MKVLLSGASGTVGIPLVAALLARDADVRLACVLRSEKARKEGLLALEAHLQGRGVTAARDRRGGVRHLGTRRRRAPRSGRT